MWGYVGGHESLGKLQETFEQAVHCRIGLKYTVCYPLAINQKLKTKWLLKFSILWSGSNHMISYDRNEHDHSEDVHKSHKIFVHISHFYL
jgi:hypothetical protein